jgi:hypothetical protein
LARKTFFTKRFEADMKGLTSSPKDYLPQEGDYILPDPWEEQHGPGAGGLISDCTNWKEAEFRLDTGREHPQYNDGRNLKVAVNVEVTGRTWRRKGSEYGYCRVKVTFVRDGKENTSVRGWMYPHNLLS